MKSLVFLALFLIPLHAQTASAGPSCVNWNNFQGWIDNKAPHIRDPGNGNFHTRLHHQVREDGSGYIPWVGRDYFQGLFEAIDNLFGFELDFLAEANGFASSESLFGQKGLSALSPFVDFDTTVYSTESDNFCASVSPITDGTHAGEYLVIMRDKSSGRVVRIGIGASEDEARAIAHDMVEQAEERRKQEEKNGVIAFPDGCGDRRNLPPGLGC